MTPAVPTITPPADQIEAQVERINASKALSGSILTQTLLKHLVTHTLAGDEAQLKEKIIGIEIFERRPDYSPEADNIVRLETEKLRHRLIAYYRLEGVKDPVRIGLRRGEFMPYFGMLETASPMGGSADASAARSSSVTERVTERSQLGEEAAGAAHQNSEGEKPAWKKHLPLAAAIAAALAAVIFLVPLLRQLPAFSPAVPSIAILPIINRSPGKTLDYTVDGFTETLRAGLAATGKLRVSSSAASFAFKNKFSNPRMISRALGVERVLQGEFRRAGDKIQIEVKLFDTESSEQLWTKKAEVSLAELAALRQSLLGELLGVLSVPVDSQMKARLQRLETRVPDAYDDYLSGLQDTQITDSGLSSGSSLVLPRAAEHFRRAIRKDPQYLAAHLGLAASLSRLSRITQRNPDAIIAEALLEWREAVRLDPENAEAQAMLGTHLALHEQDYAQGEKLLREAIRLHPLYAPAHALLAQHILLPQMRWKEADTVMARAVQLDPADPLVIESNAKLLAFEGKTKEAVTEYEKLTSGPHLLMAIARAYVEGGNLKEAQAIIYRMMQIVPSPDVQALNCYLLAWGGRKEEARQVANQLRMARQIAYVAPTAMAWLQLGLGENREALESLEAARGEKDPELAMLKVSKLYDSLRTETKFRALIAPLDSAR
jgi:TolB-like protein